MTEKTKPTAAGATPAVENATKNPVHDDYVVRVTITHPRSSRTVHTTFRLMNPQLCTDPDAINGPALARLLKFINLMIEF